MNTVHLTAKEGNAIYKKATDEFVGFEVWLAPSENIDNYEEREYIPEN